LLKLKRVISRDFPKRGFNRTAHAAARMGCPNTSGGVMNDGYLAPFIANECLLLAQSGHSILPGN
jgi:hypothetical protein